MENSMKLQTNMKNRLIILAVITGFIFLGLAAAALAQTEYKIVNTDQVKEMVAQKQAFILIDARSPQEYQEAHIKDAISIPEKELQKNLALLPEDKSALLVIYCNGVKCGKSKRLAG